MSVFHPRHLDSDFKRNGLPHLEVHYLSHIGLIMILGPFSYDIASFDIESNERMKRRRRISTTGAKLLVFLVILRNQSSEGFARRPLFLWRANSVSTIRASIQQTTEIDAVSFGAPPRNQALQNDNEQADVLQTDICNENPMVYTIHNLLTPQECHLVRDYVDQLKRSENRTMTRSNPPEISISTSKLWPLPFLSLASGLPPIARLLSEQSLDLPPSAHDILLAALPNVAFASGLSLALATLAAPIMQKMTRSSSRTSDAMALNQEMDFETIRPLVERVQQITGHPWDKWEAPVITRYDPGAIFSRHGDASPTKGSEWKDLGGQRVITCICYLNTLGEGEGGETYFDQLSLGISPVQGKGLVFFPADNQTWIADDRTTHESLPPTKEKWILQMFGRAERVPPPLGLPDSFPIISPSQQIIRHDNSSTDAASQERECAARVVSARPVSTNAPQHDRIQKAPTTEESNSHAAAGPTLQSAAIEMSTPTAAVLSREGIISASQDHGYLPLQNIRSSAAGLSKFHQSILSRTSSVRQCFVTGRYPLTISFRDCPTRKWLQWESTSELLVNQTSLTRSLASFDRFQWLDKTERQILFDTCDMVSLEFLAEIYMEKPGYVHMLPSCDAGSTAALLKQQNQDGGPAFFQQSRAALQLQQLQQRFQVSDCPAPVTDRLWVTGFSIAGRTGNIHSIDADSGEIDRVNTRTRSSLLWPNEVAPVPSNLWINQQYSSEKTTTERYQDALLVADGFLVPGKDRGGLCIVKNPANIDAEWTIRLTSTDDRWFYHRASWVDLTGDGRLSILTARCRISTRLPGKYPNNDEISTGIRKEGQLVWLECPKPDRIDPATGTPLEADGRVFDPFSANHLPWKEHVLTTGPDVMFCLADLDASDDTVEVICSEFFNERVTLSSIKKGPNPEVVFRRTLDDRCGAAFGCILADLDANSECDTGPSVIDSGSTVPCLGEGNYFSHLLVTSHECTYVETDTVDISEEDQPVLTGTTATEGGSLFAYRVPRAPGAWKTEPWLKSTVATGFRVQGQINNMINPGAPGFVYTFQPKEGLKNRRPLIAIAGDCAESAYLFRPNKEVASSVRDPSTAYKLMTEIKCEATVGSIGIGYDDFLSAEQESGYAKLYIPCFEKDKILVFGLGSGEDGSEDW